MAFLIQDLLEALDRRAPFASAAVWDAVGLQVGGPRRPVNRAAVVHEVTSAAAQRLVAGGYDAAVTYHPLLFRPLSSVVDRPGPEGRVMALAEAGVSVIAVHTSWDAAPGGCADALAAALGLEACGRFAELETGGAEGWLGRVGIFEGGADRLAAEVREKLGVIPRVAGLRGDSPAGRVAVLPGSGGSFVGEAAAAGADVYVTGDVSHHQVRLALDLGLAVIDPGHIPTERPGVRGLYDFTAGALAGAATVDDLSDPGDHPWEAA